MQLLLRSLRHIPCFDLERIFQMCSCLTNLKQSHVVPSSSQFSFKVSKAQVLLVLSSNKRIQHLPCLGNKMDRKDTAHMCGNDSLDHRLLGLV